MCDVICILISTLVSAYTFGKPSLRLTRDRKENRLYISTYFHKKNYYNKTPIKITIKSPSTPFNVTLVFPPSARPIMSAPLLHYYQLLSSMYFHQNLVKKKTFKRWHYEACCVSELLRDHLISRSIQQDFTWHLFSPPLTLSLTHTHTHTHTFSLPLSLFFFPSLLPLFSFSPRSLSL